MCGIASTSPGDYCDCGRRVERKIEYRQREFGHRVTGEGLWIFVDGGRVRIAVNPAERVIKIGCTTVTFEAMDKLQKMLNDSRLPVHEIVVQNA